MADSKKQSVGQEFDVITNSVGMKFVLIPKGKFTMGSPMDEPGRNDDEGPQFEVQISIPFYLGVTEVTQQQFEQVEGALRKQIAPYKSAQPAWSTKNVVFFHHRGS
jgi:formylglycine-generating enzyme required for sulfatase activity